MKFALLGKCQLLVSIPSHIYISGALRQILCCHFDALLVVHVMGNFNINSTQVFSSKTSVKYNIHLYKKIVALIQI